MFHRSAAGRSPHPLHPFDAMIQSAVSRSLLQNAYGLCVAKTRKNVVSLADEPKSGAFSQNGEYFRFQEGFFDIGNWTSSFFTGMALLAHETGGDDFFLGQLERLAEPYREKVSLRERDTMHDLGFLYSLYSVPLAARTGKAAHRATAVKAAEALSKRYVENGCYIRAWGRMDENDTDYAGLAIIDCLMNLPLLFWAAKETGESRYFDIALAHATTAQKHFVRADDSVFHAFRFDVRSGAPLGGDNYCGFNRDSHWARGTAWAIYGFALAYRNTGKADFLETSRRLARLFLKLTGADKVPLWDFRLPPDQPQIRDSSAAAVAACGLYELAKRDPDQASVWNASADSLLEALCTERYLDANPGCRGVLKHAQVGAGLIDGTKNYRASDVYTSWGDYFLMEALARKLYGVPAYW